MTGGFRCFGSSGCTLTTASRATRGRPSRAPSTATGSDSKGIRCAVDLGVMKPGTPLRRLNEGPLASSEPRLVIDTAELPDERTLRRLIRQTRPRRRFEITHHDPPCSGIGRRLVITALRSYQRWLSLRLRSRCLSEPSCSEYAVLAVQSHGVIRGLRETGARLRRCNPSHEGMIDYPEGVSVGLSSSQHRSRLQ